MDHSEVRCLSDDAVAAVPETHVRVLDDALMSLVAVVRGVITAANASRSIDQSFMKSLDRDYEEIVHRLGALRPDSRPRWGRLTAHQMVCHLSDGFRMLTDERRSQPLATPLPRPFMRWIALYAPLRWPTGTPTTPELDQTIGGTRPTDFTDDLAKLLALLQRIAAPQHTQFARRHPFFGRMSPAAWRRWAYLHIDHHFRQFGI